MGLITDLDDNCYIAVFYLLYTGINVPLQFYSCVSAMCFGVKITQRLIITCTMLSYNANAEHGSAEFHNSTVDLIRCKSEWKQTRDLPDSKWVVTKEMLSDRPPLFITMLRTFQRPDNHGNNPHILHKVTLWIWLSWLFFTNFCFTSWKFVQFLLPQPKNRSRAYDQATHLFKFI